MMEAIRQWGFSLCVCAVAAALAQMLAPKTGASKIFRLTVSTFFLCCIFSPLLFNISATDFELGLVEGQEQSAEIAERLQENLSSSYYRPATEGAEEELRRLLAEMGVTPNKIVINVNTQSPDSISMYQVELVLREGQRPSGEEIQARIKRELGYQAEIRYEAGTEANKKND